VRPRQLKKLPRGCLEPRQMPRGLHPWAQAAADNNDPKTLYRIVRELTGARRNSNVSIKSKDGKVLLTNDDQMKR